MRLKNRRTALLGLVAAAPLLLLGFYLLRVKLTPYWLAGIGAVFLAVLILGLRRRKHPHMDWRWLAVPAIFALMAAWRFWQAHGLVFPNWVDSLHHALIVRKMVEAGGLTATLEPYLPGPFYYHYAFHAVSALFSMLSGAAPADSVLWVGQFMAAAIGLSVYSLVKAASRDWRPGASASTTSPISPSEPSTTARAPKSPRSTRCATSTIDASGRVT